MRLKQAAVEEAFSFSLRTRPFSFALMIEIVGSSAILAGWLGRVPYS